MCTKYFKLHGHWSRLRVPAAAPGRMHGRPGALPWRSQGDLGICMAILVAFCAGACKGACVAPGVFWGSWCCEWLCSVHQRTRRPSVDWQLAEQAGNKGYLGASFCSPIVWSQVIVRGTTRSDQEAGTVFYSLLCPWTQKSAWIRISNCRMICWMS